MQSDHVNFSLSFFEVAAQLIPVLFLAMVVEEKLQPEADETPVDRVTRSWLLALLVIGELIALSVVAGGLAPSQAAGSMVASAMPFAAFLVAVPVANSRTIVHTWSVSDMLRRGWRCCLLSWARLSPFRSADDGRERPEKAGWTRVVLTPCADCRAAPVGHVHHGQ